MITARHNGHPQTAELLDRAPPNDRTAELNVAGGILFKPELLSGSGIYDTHFYDEQIRAVFNVLRQMIRDNELVDVERLNQRLKLTGDYDAVGGSIMMTDLIDHAQVQATFPHYADRLKDFAKRRQLLHFNLISVREIYDTRPTSELLAEARDQCAALAEDFDGADSGPFDVITMAELSQPAVEPEWAIEGTFILGQDGILGAPSKCMKTSSATDLIVSMATGTKALGIHTVPRPLRVLFMSAESGREASRICFNSVAESKGFNLSDIDNIFWSSAVPMFGDPGDMRRLRATLRKYQPEVMVFDPAYRTLPGDRAENMFVMGNLLAEMSDTCRSEGATPLLLHHTKSRPRTFEFTPTTIEDLAWAGFSQFFRQWILISRTAEYSTGSGVHELRFDVGGSARHSWSAAVTIDEGPFREPRWYVTVQGIEESQEAQRAAAARRKEQNKARTDADKIERDRKKLIEAAAKFPDGETISRLRDCSGLKTDQARVALAQALQAKELVACRIKKSNKTHDAYKLPN